MCETWNTHRRDGWPHDVRQPRPPTIAGRFAQDQVRDLVTVQRMQLVRAGRQKVFHPWQQLQHRWSAPFTVIRKVQPEGYCTRDSCRWTFIAPWWRQITPPLSVRCVKHIRCSRSTSSYAWLARSTTCGRRRASAAVSTRPARCCTTHIVGAVEAYPGRFSVIDIEALNLGIRQLRRCRMVKDKPVARDAVPARR